MTQQQLEEKIEELNNDPRFYAVDTRDGYTEYNKVDMMKELAAYVREETLREVYMQNAEYLIAPDDMYKSVSSIEKVCSHEYEPKKHECTKCKQHDGYSRSCGSEYCLCNN